MEKIVLFDIVHKNISKGYPKDGSQIELSTLYICMREAIDQVLLLASEKAESVNNWDEGGFLSSEVDKQSILDVKKLVFSNRTKEYFENTKK